MSVGTVVHHSLKVLTTQQTVTHDSRPHARAAYLGQSTTSTVGNRGAFSTFQLTSNTSTDHKNNNKKKKLRSPLLSKRSHIQWGTDLLPRCLRLLLFLKKAKRSLRFQAKRKKRRRFALEMSAVSNFAPSRYGGGRSVSFPSPSRSNMALIPRPFEVLVSRITQNHSEFICFVSRWFVEEMCVIAHNSSNFKDQQYLLLC